MQLINFLSTNDRSMDLTETGVSYNCLSLGSNLSLSQSPKKFMENTTSIMANPGKKHSHQAVETYCLPSDTIVPQVGAGGGRPIPRKLKTDSVRIRFPTWREESTITVLIRPGRMCLKAMRGPEAPATLARET